MEQNNALLRKMHRGTVYGRLTHLFYWIIIIGVSVWVYYYIQPYLAKISAMYSQAQNELNSVNSLKNNVTNSLKNLGN